MAKNMIGKVQIVNDTNEDILDVVLLHKYSNVYKDRHEWAHIEKRNHSSSVSVRYQVEDMGLDWWLLFWKVRRADAETVYISYPRNLRKLADYIERYCDKTIKVATGALAIATAVNPEPITKAITGALTLTGALASFLINGEETEGFKEHMLTKKDGCPEGQKPNPLTIIRIGAHDNPDKKIITFESISGKSETNYTEVAYMPLYTSTFLRSN